jgi:glycosyltransferase involved in cell wall biosynthesis
MRIGIDAKWYFEGPVSNRVVISNLVAALAANPQGHHLYFFLSRNHRNQPFPFEGAYIHKIYVWAGNNMLSNLFILPIQGKKLQLDGILYQNFGSFFGPKRWVYIHDVLFLQYPEFFSRTERWYFSLIPLLARFADKIITISRHEMERIKLFGMGKNGNIRFVHHGREGEFRPAAMHKPEFLNTLREKYGLPQNFLLYTGRINSRKNLLKLLQAYGQISTEIPMVFVGAKDWKNEPGLDEIMFQLEQQGRLILCGKIPFHDLTGIMCQATLFCYLSLAEGFGLPVLEAMASGVPVLTSENSAMAEIVGKAAMLADPQDVSSIKNALQTMLDNPKLRQELANAGLHRAEEFSWEKSAAELMAYLSDSSKK